MARAYPHLSWLRLFIFDTDNGTRLASHGGLVSDYDDLLEVLR